MKIKSGKSMSYMDGYQRMLEVFNKYYSMTKSNDYTDILSGGEYIQPDTPADPAFWFYWLDADKSDFIIANGDYTITDKQGYEAMLIMLNAIYDTTRSIDLVDLINRGRLTKDCVPNDPMLWEHWIEAINKIKNGLPPLFKEFLM